MTTISAENAKNVRRSMDVFIEISPTDFPTITITNENLINCTVSLRADLSKWEPTLPESEINIEAFFDADISDYAAGIPDGTPVTYSAGYPGDMSPTRYFYLSEQITWSDNVLHIHAVDQVHLLGEIEPATFRFRFSGNVGGVDSGLPSFYWYMRTLLLEYLPQINTVLPSTEPIRYGINAAVAVCMLAIPGDMSIRDIFANIMNLFHFDIPSGVRYRDSSFWPSYVDAGIPTFSALKPTPKWSINEDDCSIFNRNTERACSSININYKAVQTGLWYGSKIAEEVSSEIGTATWTKNVGVSLNFNDGVIGRNYFIGLSAGIDGKASEIETMRSYYGGPIYSYSANVVPLIPSAKNGEASYTPGRVMFPGRNEAIGYKCNDKNKEQQYYNYYPNSDDSDNCYAQFIPWNCPYKNSQYNQYYYPNGINGTTIKSQSDVWDAYVAAGAIDTSGSTDNAVDLVIAGANCITFKDTLSIKAAINGEPKNIDGPFVGNIYFHDVESIEIYPGTCYKGVLARSDRTGSFTWKGDPRMQPRDVFTLNTMEYGLLNENGEVLTDENGVALNGGGGSLDCTIETITLTHAGGGLSAEITYREGIC